MFWIKFDWWLAHTFMVIGFALFGYGLVHLITFSGRK